MGWLLTLGTFILFQLRNVSSNNDNFMSLYVFVVHNNISIIDDRASLLILGMLLPQINCRIIPRRKADAFAPSCNILFWKNSCVLLPSMYVWFTGSWLQIEDRHILVDSKKYQIMCLLVYFHCSVGFIVLLCLMEEYYAVEWIFVPSHYPVFRSKGQRAKSNVKDCKIECCLWLKCNCFYKMFFTMIMCVNF